MEELNIIIFTVLAVIAVIFVIYLHIKRWSRKIRINLTNDQGIRKFIELLFVYDQKVVFLNIVLSPEFVKEFKTSHSISLPQVYRSKNLSGGFRVIFDNHEKNRPMNRVLIEPNRIKGYFRIVHEAGPELGWYAIILKFPEK